MTAPFSGHYHRRSEGNGIVCGGFEPLTLDRSVRSYDKLIALALGGTDA